jgi:hypothetical protein
MFSKKFIKLMVVSQIRDGTLNIQPFIPPIGERSVCW